MTLMRTTAQGLARDHWRKVRNARQRLVLCRLMVDIMRTLHGAYAPVSEPFGTRLETFFIGLCVAIGDMDGKPFSIAKIAAYMRVPRTTGHTQARPAAKLNPVRTSTFASFDCEQDSNLLLDTRTPAGKAMFQMMGVLPTTADA